MLRSVMLAILCSKPEVMKANRHQNIIISLPLSDLHLKPHHTARHTRTLQSRPQKQWKKGDAHLKCRCGGNEFTHRSRCKTCSIKNGSYKQRACPVLWITYQPKPEYLSPVYGFEYARNHYKIVSCEQFSSCHDYEAEGNPKGDSHSYLCIWGCA